jgi:hypothetical protein
MRATTDAGARIATYSQNVKDVRVIDDYTFIIELKKVGDIIPYGKKPKVSLTANEIECYKFAFEATTESETGIAFYSWDFDHKPEDGFKADIYLDKEGKQIRKFQPGEHHIAVEAVDKSGLDGTDKVKIKVKEI